MEPPNREEMHFLTAEQVNALAAAIDDRYRAAIFLSAYGGLRAGELWALRVERLNVLAGTVDVVASMSEAGSLHAGTTKTGKRRTIAVPRFLAQMLGEHIGRYPSPDGWVFTAGEGGPVHHHNLRNRHYVRATEIAELSGVRFHDYAPHVRGAAHRRGTAPRGGQDLPRSLIDPSHERPVRTPLPRSAFGHRGRARRDLPRDSRGPFAAQRRTRSRRKRASAAPKDR